MLDYLLKTPITMTIKVVMFPANDQNRVRLFHEPIKYPKLMNSNFYRSNDFTL